MCKLVLNRSTSLEYTSVSNIFIDKYMASANGEFVKIYLYLLRMINSKELTSPLSTETIAEHFSLMESDVYRSLDYWSKEGLLNLSYNDKGELSEIFFNNLVKQVSMSTTILHQDEYMDRANYAKASGDDNYSTPAAKTTFTKTITDASFVQHSEDDFVVPKEKTYSPAEILEFKKDERINDLLFYVEAILARPMNSNDINSTIYMAKDLNMDIDFVEYFISKMVDKGHSTLKKIKSEMIILAKKGIFTKEDYKKEELVKSDIFKKIYDMFGYNAATPSKRDLDLIKKWKDDFNFSNDMIVEACNRTLDKTHKGSFSYADSILTSWFNHNAKSMEDVKPLDEEHSKNQNQRFKTFATKPQQSSSKSGSKKKSNIESHVYDFDTLEKLKSQTSK